MTPESFDPARVVYEDEHLIAVDKPPGVPCQAVDPGQRDDLPSRLVAFLAERDGGEPYLGTHQRLDAETSGLVLYTKHRDANRGVAEQMASRSIDKRYLALVDGWRGGAQTLRHTLGPLRNGRVQIISKKHGRHAVTHVEPGQRRGSRGLVNLRIETGRTHQIRAQLSASGAPIVGDSTYGGAPAARMMLHAASLALTHPVTGVPLRLEAPAPLCFGATLDGTWSPFASGALDDTLGLARERRWGLARDPGTNAYRLVNEGGDGLPGLAIDVYDRWLVAHFYDESLERERVLDALDGLGFAGVYLKRRPRQANVIVDGRDESFAPAAPVRGTGAPDVLTVHEGAVPFLVRLGEGLSTGIFLDQRENRARVRAASEGKRVLNLFSYTCGFSVAAAVGGASETVSVDASGRLLDWGADNLANAGYPGEQHRRFRGDVFGFLERAEKRGDRYDLVCVDPPTYSKTKRTRWKSGKDWVRLAERVLAVTAPGGSILACSNDRRMHGDAFRRHWHEASRQSGTALTRMRGLACPADFPPAPGEEAHLKSLWVELT